MSYFIEKTKKWFSTEKTWRFFVTLQVIGLIALIYLDTTTRWWSIIPDFTDRGRFDFHWDLLESLYWTRRSYNWYASLFIFGPFFIAKGIDWVKGYK